MSERERERERRALAKEGLRMNACYVNKGPTVMCFGEEEKILRDQTVGRKSADELIVLAKRLFEIL